MQFHNQKTNVIYKTRTTKEREGLYVSVVERLELGANNTIARAYLASREVHATRAKARHYATSMARYQFSKHCAIYGM